MTESDQGRHAAIYAVTCVAFICPLSVWLEPARAQVSLTEVDYAGLAHYKIATSNATYFLEKSGAGLSRLLDPDGTDWLNFEPTPGTGAAGEFRGFPNAVHQQAGNYFHPRNENTDASTTKIEHSSPTRVTVSATGMSGGWACRYDFFATHCTFTMTKMPSGFKYWVLYEGTPGGQYDDTDWWMTSAKDAKTPLTTPHEGDIPAPEWIAFGDQRLSRALVLYHHEDDDHPDRFYQMQRKMTVFGFGRQGGNKFLDRVAQRFSIGFVERGTYEQIRRELQSEWQLSDE
jgi:hypothetical protein